MAFACSCAGSFPPALHDDAGRQVGDAHGGFRLVDVLAAGAARADHVDAQVLGLDIDIDLLGLGQHATVAAEVWMRPLASVFGHALHAVHARLELQPCEHALCPVDSTR